MLKNIPLLGVIFIIYNLIAFITPTTLNSVIIDTSLVSGAKWTFDVNHLMLSLAIILLYIEIVKSTRTSTTSIIEPCTFHAGVYYISLGIHFRSPGRKFHFFSYYDDFPVGYHCRFYDYNFYRQERYQHGWTND